MGLTESQKKHLRGLAHHLKPVIQIGTAGVTPALANELERTLDHHELIKIKVRAGDRAARDSVIETILGKSGGILINRIGNVAIVYRQRKKDPGIKLPG
jgi:RNA-binding protein